MKKLIIILLLCFGLFACDEEEIKKQEKAEEQRAKLPERMEVIFESLGRWNDKDYYGLRDKETGREYLVVETGQSVGGIAVIELEKAEDGTSNPY